MTIEAPHGIKYTVLYALRKEGAIKNELVAKEMEDVVEYVCKANRCEKDAVRVSHKEHPVGKGS